MLMITISAIGVATDNEGNIVNAGNADLRSGKTAKLFEKYSSSWKLYEEWSLRKVLRRFVLA